MKNHHYIVANNLRSAVNVGSIFRVAESIDAKEIILQGTTPIPLKGDETGMDLIITEENDKKIRKTGMHSVDRIKWRYFKKEKEVISYLNDNGVAIYVLEEGIKESKNIFTDKFEVKEKFALVLGYEVGGVSKKFIDNADEIFYIPMYGQNKSLNVAMSAGIALYILMHR